MISKGDLVKMRLSTGANSEGGRLKELTILGKVKNYCEDEDSYILEPRVISVPKDQVTEIERLPEDFDFDDVSLEISLSQKESKHEKPPAIERIRFSRER